MGFLELPTWFLTQVGTSSLGKSLKAPSQDLDRSLRDSWGNINTNSPSSSIKSLPVPLIWGLSFAGHQLSLWAAGTRITEHFENRAEEMGKCCDAFCLDLIGCIYEVWSPPVCDCYCSPVRNIFLLPLTPSPLTRKHEVRDDGKMGISPEEPQKRSSKWRRKQVGDGRNELDWKNKLVTSQVVKCLIRNFPLSQIYSTMALGPFLPC